MEREAVTKFYGPSIRQIMRMMGCEYNADYDRLNILMDKERLERISMEEDLMSLHGTVFGQEDAPEKIEAYIRDNFKQEWFLAEAQYEEQLKEKIFYHKRMSSFFIGKKVLDANVRYQVMLAKEIGYTHSKLFQGVVHVITVDEKNSPNAIIFKAGKPVYKWGARKPDTKIENAPELLAAYIGLSPVYGSELKVTIVYLKCDNDSIENESLKKTQIVTADFSRTEEKILKDRLQRVLTEFVEKDCDSCRYKILCKGEARIVEQENKALVPGKTPIFTASQQEVVDFGKGACAVYAVPGAGKTTTLVYRLCRMISSGIDPQSIMFVTFTRKAAAEIKDRVKKILGTEKEVELPDIYTYNGLGWQIIRDHPEVMGVKKLLSPMDEKILLLDIINRSEKLTGYRYSLMDGKFGLLNQLQKTFNGILRDKERELDALAKAGRNTSQIMKLFAEWINAIKDGNYITYDEQVTLAVQLLKKCPDALAAYGSRWNYIMADEFQDSSQDNVELLYMLAKAGGGNIVVVGDADQSIFEWRDGSPKHLLNFGDYFPAKKIIMNDNFRSSEKILDASNQLIARNMDRIDISMQAHIKGNVLPYRVKNSNTESVLRILELLREKHVRLENIAILSRKNAALEKCRQILEQVGIGTVSPSDLLIKDVFFILIKDVLNLYIDGMESSDMSFFRLCKFLGAELPKKTDTKKTFYQDMVDSKRISPIDIHDMDSMIEYSVDCEDKNGDKIYAAAKKIHTIFLEMQMEKPAVFVQRAAEIIGYDPEDPAVKALLSVVEQHEPMETLQELKEYMEIMLKIGDETMVEHGLVEGKVNLMTAHGAKGKEFPAVIVLQSEDFQPTEEERRLMYVAMTRAKKVLFLMESVYEHCKIFDEGIDECLQTISMPL